MTIIEKIRDIQHYMPTPDESEGAISLKKLEREKFQAARDAMSTLIDLTNTCGFDDAIVAGIVDGIVGSHRYLQSRGVMALFHALGEYGNLPEGQYTDARNKFVHKLARLLRERFSDEIYWEGR